MRSMLHRMPHQLPGRLEQPLLSPETAVFQYKCDEFYHPEADGGINIKDESLGIDWRIPVEKAILCEKDLKHACLKDAVLDFDINDKLYK